MHKIKILQLIVSSQIGGATVSLYNQLNLLRNDYDFFIATPSCGPMVSRFEEIGCKVHVYPFLGINWFFGNLYKNWGGTGFLKGLIQIFKLIKAYPDQNRWLIDFIQSNSIEIVHIHSIGLISLIPALQKSNVKVIWHVRDTLSNVLLGIPRLVISRFIRNCHDRIIGISSNEVRAFRHDDHVSIIFNFVDFSKFNYQISINEALTNVYPLHSFNDNELRVGMMSQFASSKGIIEFIKAALIIHSRQKNTKFYLKVSGYDDVENLSRLYKLFGKTGKLKRQVLKLIKQNNADSYIQILSEPIDIPSYLRTMDVYVRPDRMGCPWGRDIIEAMAMGKPIVATGDCEEFIVNGETGLLVPAKNPVKMAVAIIDLLVDPVKRKKMEMLGLARAKKLFDVQKNCMRIKKIYNDLIDDTLINAKVV